VAPIRRLRALLEPGGQRRLKVIGQQKALTGCHAPENFAEIRSAIGREVDRLAEATGEPGVAVDEASHLVAIASDNDDNSFAIVFHELEQRIDGFLAEI